MFKKKCTEVITLRKQIIKTIIETIIATTIVYLIYGPYNELFRYVLDTVSEAPLEMTMLAAVIIFIIFGTYNIAHFVMLEPEKKSSKLKNS